MDLNLASVGRFQGVSEPIRICPKYHVSRLIASGGGLQLSSILLGICDRDIL